MTTTLTENKSYFQPNNFKVVINRKRFGNIEFFAQSVIHPGLSTPAAEVPTGRTTLPTPGSSITFGELTINAILDEDLNVYEEMYNWMIRLVNEAVKSPNQAALDGSDPTTATIKVIALTSHNNSNKTFTYYDAIPVNLADMNFDTMNSQVEPIQVPMSFRFSTFDLD
jgi:hypothetical protein